MSFAKIIFSILICSPLCFTSAFAHDVHNWSGFYVGGNVGATKNTLNITDINAVSFNATLEQATNPQFSGGFQAGYRQQLNTNQCTGVYGLEFSAHFSNVQFTKEYGSAYALYQFKAHHVLKDTLLMQFIGGIGADKTLLFLAAGVSWVKSSGEIINQDGLPFVASYSISKNAAALAVGAGIEHAFTKHVSTRLKLDVISPNSYSSEDNTRNTYQISNHVVQGVFGINYKFG